jgi:hypothetical protein
MYVLHEVPKELFQHEIKMLDYFEYNELKAKYSETKTKKD